MLKSDSAIIVFSGGQDSTTCLMEALTKHQNLHLITFDYGQRHKIEIEAAQNIFKLASYWYPQKSLTHEVIDVGSSILLSTSPLTSQNELEQYTDHQSLPGGLEKTFVPMRNQLFLTIAANRAMHHRARYIYTGVCEEDFGGYPDCRQDFILAIEHATAESLGAVVEGNAVVEGPDAPIIGYNILTGMTPEIVTPLMHLTKAHSVELALTTPHAYTALAFSHTAYDGQFPPTGHDHATLLREKGFEEAGVMDPLWVRAGLLGIEVPQKNALPVEDAQILAIHRAVQALSFSDV